MPLLALLRKARDEIVAAKMEWLLGHDIGKLRERAGTTLYSLLKYFSCLFGHEAGLGKPPSQLAPETRLRLNANAWLLPWVGKLKQVLSSMVEAFEEWKSLDVFEPLKQPSRGLFGDCGIVISYSNGSLYVLVGAGKLPVSSF